MTDADIPQPEVDRLYDRLKREAEASGYHLNLDAELLEDGFHLPRHLLQAQRAEAHRGMLRCVQQTHGKLPLLLLLGLRAAFRP